MVKDHDTELLKQIVDGLSIVTLIGSLIQVLPAVASVFTIIWTSIRIYESETVQRLINRKKDSSNET